MNLSKGQLLFVQGDIADSLYVIRSGKIGLFLNGPHGPIELAQLGPGQIVGDLSYFTGSLRTSDAIATTDAECLRVPYESVRAQFELAPAWIQSMTKTLATQVQAYSSEIKPLRDRDAVDSAGGARVIMARALAALILVPHQFGTRDGEAISIDWPTLRSFSNLCFREISDRVMQLAKALEPTSLCAVRADARGPVEITLKQPKVFADFLDFYRRAIIQNSPDLSTVRPVEYETLTVLASPQLTVTPIHRGQVEIDLQQFKDLATSSGHPEVTATSVDLLGAYGIEVTKASTETGVKLRFHQEEVVSRAKFWQILKAIQEMDRPKKVSGAA